MNSMATLRQRPTGVLAFCLGLASATWAASCLFAGPVPLRFDDGNGNSQVDQYVGVGGSGWAGAWSAQKYSGGSITATVTAWTRPEAIRNPRHPHFPLVFDQIR